MSQHHLSDEEYKLAANDIATATGTTPIKPCADAEAISNSKLGQQLAMRNSMPHHEVAVNPPAVSMSASSIAPVTLEIPTSSGGVFAAFISGNDSDLSEKIPEKFRWNVGEERIVIISQRERDILFSFVHDCRKHGIPELEGVSVQCQRGCPLCMADKLPQSNLIAPAVDVATLTTGLMIASGGCVKKPGESIDKTPIDRLTVDCSSKTIMRMLINALNPPSLLPSTVTLRITRPKDNAYLVLPATVAAEFQPPEELVAQAIEAARRHREAIVQGLGMSIPVSTLRDIPTVNRMLRLTGKI
jgi:hypothetical protein